MTTAAPKYKPCEMVLTCILTDDERRARGIEIGACLEKLDEVEDEFKTVKSRFDRDRKELAGKIKDLGRAARTGEEMRTVDCQKVFDYESSRVHWIRNDTGEIFKERAMYDDEKQFELFKPEPEEEQDAVGQAAESAVNAKEFFEDKAVFSTYPEKPQEGLEFGWKGLKGKYKAGVDLAKKQESAKEFFDSDQKMLEEQDMQAARIERAGEFDSDDEQAKYSDAWLEAEKGMKPDVVDAIERIASDAHPASPDLMKQPRRSKPQGWTPEELEAREMKRKGESAGSD